MKEIAKQWGPSVFMVLAAGGLLAMAWNVRELNAAGSPNFQRHEAKDDERQKTTDARLDRLERLIEKSDARWDQVAKDLAELKARKP